jgi:hypothetical protein
MIGFVLRLLGLWTMAGAVVALVIDGTRSIALQRFAPTPLYQTWRTLAPASYAGTRKWVESNAHPMVWNAVEWMLGLPAWSVLIVLGALLLLAGSKRRRSRVRFST